MENLAPVSNAIDIVKKEIVVDRALNKETTQVLCEGDIIVPDIKPDINLILQNDASIVIEKVESSIDRLNIVGKVHVSVLYLAKGSDNPVHSLTHTYPIDDFINIAGLTKDSIVDLKHDLSGLDFNIVNDRKISYRGVLDISVSGTVKDHREAVVEVTGLALSQQQRGIINLIKTVSNKNDRFIIKAGIDVPSGKQNIVEILNTSFELRNKNVRSIGGKIQITGDLNISILYRGNDEQLLEFFEVDEPFTSSIEVEEATEEMFADATLKVLDKFIQILQNEDGEDRVVGVEVTIGSEARVSTKEEIEYLKDAYSITDNLLLDTQSINYPHFVARNKNQATIKEILTLPANLPNILQVFRVKGKAHLVEAKATTDKVTVEGNVAVDIMYIAKDDDVPLFSHKTNIVYRQVVEAPGATANMEVATDVVVDGIHFNLLSENEVELRVTASFSINVNEKLEAKLVKNIEVNEIDQDFIDNQASITVYVATKGDTLWQIAKRYHTSVEELVELNEIANPDILTQGQKLIILKKVG